MARKPTREQPLPVREPKSRRRLWRALRQLRTSETSRLVAVTEVARGTVQRDLRCLYRTGYIAKTRHPNPTGGTETVWRLVRDTGPKPPMFLFAPDRGPLTGALDRNTRRTFGLDGKPLADDLTRARANWLPKVVLAAGKPGRRGA